jgi:hypothetical protein
MHSYILGLGDEDAKAIWLSYGIDEDLTEKDLMEMAENENVFNDLSYRFGTIMLATHNREG